MILELLDKISHCPSYYQPSEEEQPTVEFLHKQGFVHYVNRERVQGYHITLNGVLYRNEKQRQD